MCQKGGSERETTEEKKDEEPQRQATHDIYVDDQSDGGEDGESSVYIIVRDMSALTSVVSKVTLLTTPKLTVGELLQEVGRRFKYEPDSFTLILQRVDGEEIEVDKVEPEKSLGEAGFRVEGSQRNNLVLSDQGGVPPRRTDEDDLSLGASASPTANSAEKKWFERSNNYENPSECSYSAALIKQETGYIGLVNQAMTCYLNSLLQTLFMTPEFRNALYRWEFKGSEEEASKNIPCQLQRLFLMLQTANKSAVETTSLTRSFGWDSSEAWQQHDIQELCRVMFDALELSFKNTDQADLINRLYEGKMKDYVKCLECGYESAREDTYLDIPLPIRPFGSSTAYQSVEEALKHFVEPEVLTGNNKYKCSKCNNLCDAHKGLKFTRFPYLLTIHLKRFDFDYQTLHRIKLNDKVTFPNVLDLNNFIDCASETKEEKIDSTTHVGQEKVTQDKPDDASTSDSGLATIDGEDSSIEHTHVPPHPHENTDEDEGIDVSSMYNEKNKTCLSSGPFVYDLFSIMVHSGSASGGHYYAYIKDLTTGEWYCFNDQSVSRITYDDIRKTYGGGSSRGYYSNWSSSANAYMLMYRQIDKEKNVDSFTKEHFPKHITELVQRMADEEAAEREAREMERSMCRIKLFCQHPTTKHMMEKKLRIHKDTTLRETVKLAYEELELEGVVPLERCRLVKYEEVHDSLECSFDGQDDELISEILGGVRSSYKFDLLMEIRDEDKQFEVYKPGGTTVKVHLINLQTEEVEGPFTVRGSLSMTVREFKELLGRHFSLNPDAMRVVLERYYNGLKLLTGDTKALKLEGFYRSSKVYVEASGIEPNDFFTGSIMYHIMDRYENTITLHCSLPDTSSDALAELQIPAYKEENTEAGASSSTYTTCTTASTTTSTSVTSSAPSLPTISTAESASITTSSSTTIVTTTTTTPSDSTSASSPASSHSKESGVCSKASSDTCSQSGSSVTTPSTAASTSVGAASDGEDEGIVDPDSGAGSSTVNSDQSASEDSSLTSDSDRTLVGDPPEDKLSDTSSSPDYRNVSSPEDNVKDSKVGSDIGWGLPLFQDQTNSTVSGWVEFEEDKEDLPVKRYFRAHYYTDHETNQKMLRVYVDKRITFGQLKTEMQPWVGVSQEHFKFFKSYSISQEFECTRMTETLASYGDNARLTVRLGRALLPGEQRGKVYFLELDNPDDPAKFLIDWVICKGDTVANVKRAVVKEANQRCQLDLKVENVRLRKKSWKNPQTIYLDPQKFEDNIPLYSNWELFLQVIEGPEMKTDDDDELSIFVKRWRPSSFTTDPVTEIVIPEATSEALREKLSSISGIAVDNVEFAKGQGTFPFDMPVVSINQDLDWIQRPGPLDSRPLYISEDGALVYYRDKTETEKELSEDERRELSNSENRRLNRDLQYSCPGSSSSGHSTLRSKEKGLRIYLNHNPTEE